MGCPVQALGPEREGRAPQEHCSALCRRRLCSLGHPHICLRPGLKPALSPLGVRTPESSQSLARLSPADWPPAYSNVGPSPSASEEHPDHLPTRQRHCHRCGLPSAASCRCCVSHPAPKVTGWPVLLCSPARAALICQSPLGLSHLSGMVTGKFRNRLKSP